MWWYGSNMLNCVHMLQTARLIQLVFEVIRGSVLSSALAICFSQNSVAVTLGFGAIEGDPNRRLAATVEQVMVQSMPDLMWLSGSTKAKPQLAIDLTVFGFREDSRPFRQENRICKRFSASDPKAKNWFERAASRSCLEYEDRSKNCRKVQISLDVASRIHDPITSRVVASGRQSFSTESSVCDPDVHDLLAMRAALEQEASKWVVGRIAAIPNDVLGTIVARSAATSSGQESAKQASQPQTDKESMSQGTPKLEMLSNPLESLNTVERQRSNEKRFALVIGNGTYAGSARLDNPVADSEAIAARLKRHGFQVYLERNLTRQQMIAAIQKFSMDASDADLSVFYFAGHGVQINGVNFLVPIDVGVADASRMGFDAVPLNTLIDTALPGKARLVFLDACRDNPWLKSGTRGLTRGLAPISVASGTLISYATKDGSVAFDGSGKHSPFTQALLEHIDQPEDIGILLRRVRERVMSLTNGQQQPWEYGSLTGGALILAVDR
jgi:hypothetical protein